MLSIPTPLQPTAVFTEDEYELKRTKWIIPESISSRSNNSVISSERVDAS